MSSRTPATISDAQKKVADAFRVEAYKYWSAAADHELTKLRSRNRLRLGKYKNTPKAVVELRFNDPRDTEGFLELFEQYLYNAGAWDFDTYPVSFAYPLIRINVDAAEDDPDDDVIPVVTVRPLLLADDKRTRQLPQDLKQSLAVLLANGQKK